MDNTRLEYLAAKARKLPLEPGVYIMKDAGGKIIYIGKAKALKNRVSTYFGSQERHIEKVRKMVFHVKDFDYIIVNSEFEALILECSLIKLHQPKYNILLKDDKGYHYIKITKPPYRRISTANQIQEDGSTYLGPYNSSYAVRHTVEEACKIFKLPTCSRVFPRDIGKQRECLNFFIKQCNAPCSRKISLANYEEIFDEALDFIKNGSTKSTEDITRRMEEAAEQLDFEKAARLRDKLRAIKSLNQKQKVVSSSVANQDIITLATAGELSCFAVLRFENGRLVDKQDYLIDAVVEAGMAMSEFITQYYTLEQSIPPRITLEHKLDDEEIIKEYFSKELKSKMQFVIPQRGEQHQLVQMCKINASEKLAQKLDRTNKEASGVQELAELLGLSKPPRYIESYDISHTAGDENVGAMVVFFDGRAHKSAYKKFKIKGFEGQDDYASMAEVVERRFKNYVDNKNGDEGFGTLPDIILLDGGKGQVNAVLPVLEKYGLQIPVFGMVKDSKHKTKAISAEGQEIAIKSTRAVYTLLTKIQDEVHRFAIGYHHKRKQKSTINTTLTNIDGVGPATAQKLLKHYKTMSAISSATTLDIVASKLVNVRVAENIFNYFNNKSD